MLAPSSQYVVVLDTCVLAPMPLCDTLLRLAEEPVLYVPKWSDDILCELRSTLMIRVGEQHDQHYRVDAARDQAAGDDALHRAIERVLDAQDLHQSGSATVAKFAPGLDGGG
jgi:hypothetical protein